MKLIKGKFNSAKVFTDVFDKTCEEQIRELLDQEVFKNAKIRIMPDCHTGKSCVIGFTANLGDKVIPDIVGVDIGCGMYTVELGQVDIGFARFDTILNKYIPYGRNIHKGRMVKIEPLHKLTCYRELKDSRKIERSIGSLGSGNHFIEIDTDKYGNVNEKTLDESPMAYKGIEDIMDNITETVSINKILKPVYNFKSYYIG